MLQCPTDLGIQGGLRLEIGMPSISRNNKQIMCTIVKKSLVDKRSCPLLLFFLGVHRPFLAEIRLLGLSRKIRNILTDFSPKSPAQFSAAWFAGKWQINNKPCTDAGGFWQRGGRRRPSLETGRWQRNRCPNSDYPSRRRRTNNR